MRTPSKNIWRWNFSRWAIVLRESQAANQPGSIVSAQLGWRESNGTPRANVPLFTLAGPSKVQSAKFLSLYTYRPQENRLSLFWWMFWNFVCSFALRVCSFNRKQSFCIKWIWILFLADSTDVCVYDAKFKSGKSTRREEFSTAPFWKFNLMSYLSSSHFWSSYALACLLPPLFAKPFAENNCCFSSQFGQFKLD